MKNLRTISMGLLLVMIISILFTVPAFASQQVSVYVNDQKIGFPDAQPFIDENSRTLVPVRFVSEALGADVTWYDEDQQVFIEKDDITISLAIGSHWITTNKRNFEMDTAPVIINDRTFVPLRFVSEFLNCDVQWEQDTYSVKIREIVMPVSEEDFEVTFTTDGKIFNDKDTTPIKEVIVYENLNINIEEGDTYTNENGYLVINKYSGLTIKYINPDNLTDTEQKPYAIIFNRNKDLNKQIYDLTDDVLFYEITDTKSDRYNLEVMVATSWANGIQDKEYFNAPFGAQFIVKDGENNTIVIEGWKY